MGSITLEEVKKAKAEKKAVPAPILKKTDSSSSDSSSSDSSSEDEKTQVKATEEVKKALSDDVRKIVNLDPRISVELIKIDQYEHGLAISLDLRAVQTNELETMILAFDRNSQTLTSQ